MTEEPRTLRPPLRDGIWLAAAALATYLLLGQSRFYLFDAETFYMLVARGDLGRINNHPLYLPINGWVAAALEPFGVSLFRAMTITSALGTALFVLFAHRAAAGLGLDRAKALGVAALCATAPSVVFFATVIEVHGVFLAFAGLAWWMAARAVSAPTLARALGLGLSTGLAASAHATGNLLPIAAGLLMVAEVPALRRFGPLARWAVAGAVGHATARVAVGLTLGGGDVGQTLDYVASQWHRMSIAQLPSTLWNEWLVAFAPLAWIAIASLLVRTARPVALAMHAALIPYWVAAAFMLGRGIAEHGAYFQPLAFVAALAVVRWLPGRAVMVCAVVALVTGITEVRRHDRAAPDAVRPADVIALRGEGEAVFVMAGEAESRPVMLAAPDLAIVRVEILTQELLGDDDETAFARFDDAFHMITGGGRGVVYLSQAAARELVLRGDRLAGHLERAYELIPHESGTFQCYELRAR